MTVDPRQVALATLVDLLGLPYLWPCKENGYKGKNPADGGLDCSGAVNWARYKAGLVDKSYVPKYNANDIFRELKSVAAKDTKIGDLVFYGRDRVTHVMMLAGDGMCIGEAGGGSRVTTVEIAKKLGACMKYKPVRYRTDIVGYGRLV